jgi:hypothetical protein
MPIFALASTRLTMAKANIAAKKANACFFGNGPLLTVVD